MSSLDNATISAVSARRVTMLEPDEVTAMLRLNKLGWGSRRIAREFGCSRTTVQRYVDAGGWQEYRSPRKGVSKLDGHEAWLRECFFRHRGNADVVRQDLARELGVRVSLRTIERAVEIDTNAYSVPWRLVGESVQVTLSGAQVRIFHGGQMVAEHAEASGRHCRLTDPAHFVGVSGASGPVLRPVNPEMVAMRPPDLLRCAPCLNMSNWQEGGGNGYRPGDVAGLVVPAQAHRHP